MSIYAVLLETALQERQQPGPPVSPGARLAELLRCRSQLQASTSRRWGSDRVAIAVADQLAYDIALIEFARGPGSTLTRAASIPHSSRGAGLRKHSSCRGFRSTAPTSRNPERSRCAEALTYVPVASRRSARADRSSRRAAYVAAWVRRSIPSLARRLET